MGVISSTHFIHGLSLHTFYFSFAEYPSFLLSAFCVSRHAFYFVSRRSRSQTPIAKFWKIMSTDNVDILPVSRNIYLPVCFFLSKGSREGTVHEVLRVSDLHLNVITCRKQHLYDAIRPSSSIFTISFFAPSCFSRARVSLSTALENSKFWNLKFSLLTVNSSAVNKGACPFYGYLASTT
jgi:hypothetical protein